MNTFGIKVIFYEWSDIDRQPIGFTDKEQFINFCRESNINISKRNLNFLDENYKVYATCKKGKNELIMSSNNKNFRKNYSKHRNG